MMWKLLFVSIGFIISAVLSYLPYLQQTTQYTPQYTSLQLEMINHHASYLNRKETDQAVISHSQRTYYDEATQYTELTPFNFIVIRDSQRLTGRSEQATITQDIINLKQQVSLKQEKNNQFSEMTTEHLILDQKHTLLFSPLPVQLRSGTQTTTAQQMIGNYKEGIYEFTQQVHSHWTSQ